MRKLIFVLLALAMLAPIAARAQRVLYITSDGGTASDKTNYVNAGLHRTYRTLGYKYDVLMAADTTAVQAAFTSGVYGICIPVNLPDITSAFDSHAEIVAAGWGNLDEWVNPTHPNHAEIPMLMIIPSDMVTSGVWATAYTGVLAKATGNGTTEAMPLLSASGDSLYANIHWSSGSAVTGIKTRVQDSLSWCDAIIWVNTAVPSGPAQKYALIWRTVSTAGYPVYYIKNGIMSWAVGYVAAIIGAYATVTPVEIPIQLMYGYTNKDLWGRSGGTIDTIGSEYCMDKIINYVLAHEMKLEIILDQTMLKSELKHNMTHPINRMIAHPEHFQLTHWTYHSARTSNPNWFSYNATTTASQMANAIALTQAATTADTLATGHLDNTRALGYQLTYGGGYGATATRIDSVLDVATAAGITDLYVASNSYDGEMSPYTNNYGLIGSQRTWIGPTFTELRTHAVCWDYSVTFGVVDSQKVAYMTRTATLATRGTYAATALKYGFGAYVVQGGTILNTTSASGVNRTVLAGTFNAGYLYGQALISGGSHTGGGYHLAGIDSTKSTFADHILPGWYAQARTMNDIVTRYGSTGTPVAVWSFGDQVKRDRILGRAFINSHVRHE